MLSIDKVVQDELFLNFVNRFELHSLLKLWKMKTTREAESDIIENVPITSHTELCRDRMDTESSTTSYTRMEREEGRGKEEGALKGKEELHPDEYLGQTH